MQAVTLNVDDEIKALADAVGTLFADIKAGKTLAQDLTDALGGVVAGVTGLANIVGDIKKVDNQTYLLHAILTQLEPVVPATTPAT